MLSIFNSIISGKISVAAYAACLLCAGLCGLIAALSVSWKNSVSRSFFTSLIVLPPIVATVVLMVNGNIGTGIAVAGAFSLVRFRSAAGKAQDISAIFMAMTAGLACAGGYVWVALLFTVVVSAMFVLLSRVPLNSDKFLDLNITVPESMHFADAFDDLFEKYTKSWELAKVKTSNMGSLFKLSYKIEIRDASQAKEFLDEIRCRNENLEVALMEADIGGDEL